MYSRLETLRGAACLLLVFYHVVGADSASGLRVDEGWLRTVNDWLAVIRMPLFGVLAGWFYGERPACAGHLRAFAKSKTDRLLIPLLTVGCLYWTVHALTPGVNQQSVALPFIMPVAHLWFLQALLLILALLALLDVKGLLRTQASLTILLLGSTLLYLFGPTAPILGLGGAVYLMPFVGVGLGLRRFGDVRRLEDPACLLLLLPAAWVLSLQVQPELGSSRHNLVYLALAACLVLLALGSRLRSDLLVKVGGYSYTIFLFHVFFTASSRIFLSAAGVDSLSVMVAAGFAAGVLGPIFLHHALAQYPLAARLFLGGPGRKRAHEQERRSVAAPPFVVDGIVGQATAVSGRSTSLESRST